MSNILDGLDESHSRELTSEERMKWGTCPTCGARNGEYCHADVGMHLGTRAGGGKPQDGDGTHLGRLQRAPMRIKVTAA